MEVKAIMETEQKGIIIPFKKEIDMTFANIANEKAKLIARENAALAYSERCKRKEKHENLWCALSGVSLFGTIIALYVLGCII